MGMPLIALAVGLLVGYTLAYLYLRTRVTLAFNPHQQAPPAASGYRDSAKPDRVTTEPEPEPEPEPKRPASNTIEVSVRNNVAVFKWKGREFRRDVSGLGDWTIREWPSLRKPEHVEYRALDEAYGAYEARRRLGKADVGQ